MDSTTPTSSPSTAPARLTGSLFIAMRLIEGEDLEQIIEPRGR